jgi:hypothetical protein
MIIYLGTIAVAVLVAVAGCGSSNGEKQRDLGTSVDQVLWDSASWDVANDQAVDAFGPLDGFGQISGQCGVLDDTVWSSQSPAIFRNAIDFGSAAFDPAKLSPGGLIIWNEGTRGGSSVHSEIFAYEVLYRCELAKLLKTETQISYEDPGGKKTDLQLEIDAVTVGVSVTRAYHYPPDTPYTEVEAKQLLDKKLADLPLSQANATAQDAWTRSILHVIAYDAQHADAVQSAWNTQVSSAVKGDAILMLTVTDGEDQVLY